MRSGPDVVAALKTERTRLSKWLATNGTSSPGYRKANLAHRLVNDLIARGGGTAGERAYVDAKIAEMQSR